MIIQGIVPPIVTPLQSPDSLDNPGLERLIARQLDAGVNGLFVLGTTGEGPGLSAHIQRQMVKQTRQLTENSKLPIYVGVTHTSLVESTALSSYAADLGATAVVAAPPYYFPAGQPEVRRWFELLADQSPIPLILYNMPSCVRIEIAAETLADLLPHPNIVGFKDSSGNLDYLNSIVQVSRRRENWPVLVGPEALLIDAMRLGAVGGVTGGANLCPHLFTQLYRAILADNQPEMQRLQQVVMELQQLYQHGSYGPSYLKSLKCSLQLTGLCSGLLAAPFDLVSEEHRQQIELWLQKFSQFGYLPTNA